MIMYPVDVAAETLGVSTQWLTRLCHDRRVPGAVKAHEVGQPIRYRQRWMVPIDFRVEHVKFKQARKGQSNGRKRGH